MIKIVPLINSSETEQSFSFNNTAIMTINNDKTHIAMLTDHSQLVKIYQSNNDLMDSLTVFLIVFVSIMHTIKTSKRRKGSPPGPYLRIPLIGHVESFLMGSDLVKKSRKLRERYGDIFSYNVVGVNTVHLCSFDLISKALKMKEVSSRIPFKKFSKIDAVLSEVYIHGYHGLVVTEGEEWREQRRFCLKTLKNFGFGKSSLETIIQEETQKFCSELRQECQKGPIDLSNRFNVMVINILWRIIGGKSFDYKDQQFAELVQHLTKGFSAIAPTPKLALLFAFPFLRKLFPKLTGFDVLKRGYHGVYKFLEQEIKSHQENLDMDNPKDFIDAYLIEMKKKTEEGDVNSTFFEEKGIECLFCVLHDLFLAGSETSSTFLLWATIMLLRHPEVQSRIQQELDEVVGQDRLPNIQDQTNTPYTLAFIDEVHRFASHVPLGVQHWTNKDIQVDGFTIPANSIIIPNISEVHHEQQFWGSSRNEFRPERLLNTKGEYVKRKEIIPYSLGVRRCPGESLAKSEIYLAITALLQNFKFSSPQSEDAPSLEYNYGFTLTPQKFKVNLTPRF